MSGTCTALPAHSLAAAASVLAPAEASKIHNNAMLTASGHLARDLSTADQLIGWAGARKAVCEVCSLESSYEMSEQIRLPAKLACMCVITCV